MSDRSQSDRLLIPALGCVWSNLHNFSETILRVLAGGMLVIHGSSKVVDPFRLTDMIAGTGMPAPALLSFGVAMIEFFGGIMLALGLFTRLVALGAFIVLLNTVYFHWVVFGQGFKGSELSILWSAVAFFFFIRGGNAHSIDAKLPRTF